MTRVPPLPRVVESAADAGSLLQALAHEARTRLSAALPPGTSAASIDGDPLLRGLLHVAARYGEILCRSIDAAPALHLEAFAHDLGARPRPPREAQTHLVFEATSGGSSRAAVVPMHTRVMAPQPGEREPVPFETSADLLVVRAAVARAVVVEGGHRRMADLPLRVTSAPAPAAAPLAWRTVPAELHLSHADFGLAGLQQVRVRVEFEPAPVAPAGDPPASRAPLEWGIATPTGFVALPVLADSTDGLVHDGEVALAAPAAWPEGEQDGLHARWLTLRRVSDAGAGGPRRVRRIVIGVDARQAPRQFDQVARDSLPLDASKEFFPLGERPSYGACWVLQSSAFAQPGTRVQLHVELVNPAEAQIESATPSVRSPGEVAPVERSGNPVLRWEISTADGFTPLGASDPSMGLSRSFDLDLVMPPDVAPRRINGVTAPCLRACLVGGDYRLRAPPKEDPGRCAPPIVKALQLRTTLRRDGLAPEHLVLRGALALLRVAPGAPFDLFPVPDVAGVVAYLGFDGGDVSSHLRRRWQLLVEPAPAPPPTIVADGAPPADAPRWQIGTPTGWVDLRLDDGTRGLTSRGILRLEDVDAAARRPPFELDPERRLLWFRLVWTGADAQAVRLPAGLWPNAVPARQVERLRDEILGSGTGLPRQACRILRPPIVGDVNLQVREADGSLTRWHEAQTHDLAGPDDCNFILDRVTGLVRFGDGCQGRIPPRGPNNLRVVAYDSGGGARGNVPAGAIVQPGAALQGVASVFNPWPAAGGADASAGVEQAAVWSWLVHRDRAVGVGDFAALAKTASPEVAHAFAFASCDLSSGAAADEAVAGAVSVVVLSHGDGPRPQPDPGLLQAVKARLDACRAPGVRVVVSGPSYATVGVHATIEVAADESPHDVCLACRRRLRAFLHPLTGDTGDGWRPGRRVARSDLYRVLAQVPGVEAVVAVTLQVEGPPGATAIVAAGDVQVEAES